MDEKKTYRQFTFDDRKILEKMYKNYSVTEIAAVLGKNTSSIYRELQKCEYGNYTAKQAFLVSKARNNKKYKSENLSFKLAVDKKQIETCIRMQPTISPIMVSKVTGINQEVVDLYYNDIQKQIITRS